MPKRKIVSFLLAFVLIASCFPTSFAFAATAKNQRKVYLHAQGENPQTVMTSTVYRDKNTDIYLAVDNPNKGGFENGVHKHPEYDLNGYTVTVYYDPYYFDLAGSSSKPIDYTIPDIDKPVKDNFGNIVQPPTSAGYFVYRQGVEDSNINGKDYKAVYLTVFFNGSYLPEKQEGRNWYNLCKLPLRPKNTGSTQVFFDTSGTENRTLELFAKNESDNLKDQTFDYIAENGGYHTIVIKDKAKPSAPAANPPEGRYTQTQYVTLSAEEDCEIYYSLHGETPHLYDNNPITVNITTTITCYAQRTTTDLQKSTEVSFTYKIVPRAPVAFFDDDGTKEPITTSIYDRNSTFSVYIAESEVYGPITDGTEIYYTYTNASEEDAVNVGNDPSSGWARLSNVTQKIDITQKTKLRLIAKKLDEFSSVSEYVLGIRPDEPYTDKSDDEEYENKLDVSLCCDTRDAEIYYTIDGSDPVTNGIPYNGFITLRKDTTLRAVSKFDGFYSEVVSYHYIFKSVDDFRVDAFYPSGVYDGSVNVTLTAIKPENDIMYSTDGGNRWFPYTSTLVFENDTDLLAKAGKDGVYGEVCEFTYRIKPYPPEFTPESTQFTNNGTVTIFCPESTVENEEHYKLFYTLDNSDPRGENGILADGPLDTKEISITDGYTVIKAVVLKDDTRFSDVVTHSYDIVTQKPLKPVTTLIPGSYIRKIGDNEGFSTKFMPVVGKTEIYYCVSNDDSFIADPLPNVDDKYNKQPIEVKGHTVIKAVAVNVFGTMSDIGIFEYTVTPEAPKAAPSATLSGNRLPVVPAAAVNGSTVSYDINGIQNSFVCDGETFYIDTNSGNAYSDIECTVPLGRVQTETISSPAVLSIKSELDGVQSQINRYEYKLSRDQNTLAVPYTDKETGDYEEIKADADNNFLHIHLYSLNDGDTIQYKVDNGSEWSNYDGEAIKIKQDTVLQIRSIKGGYSSTMASYVYNFIPLRPIISLESGRYLLSDNPETYLEFDSRAPTDKIENGRYRIMYRQNGDPMDYSYDLETPCPIDHTMSFKAYVVNRDTGKISKNTISYYIIESENAASGSVSVASPYNKTRISAALLVTGNYADGIKLFASQSSGIKIYYYYTYTTLGNERGFTTNTMLYDNIPITVNPSMTSIEITAWLENEDGRIENSECVHSIEFVHLNVPKTSLGASGEFAKNTAYTLLNDYQSSENVFLYYTLEPDGDPEENGTLYNGESLTLTESVVVKAVYMSTCETNICANCRNDDPQNCLKKVYGPLGEYRYTVPTVIGGGGGGTTIIDNTRKYTKDIFGNEHPTHISYINGYPDGSVMPDGRITREETVAILYRITNHEYENPFIATGNAFPDVKSDRWSAHDVEYMAQNGTVTGYPDGEFKPQNYLTRAEFAALVCRFAGLENSKIKKAFSDLESTHWAYDNILSLVKAGLINGYEDGTFRPEGEITRAEVMTVINKLLGRKPIESYVKSLGFNPFTDLEKDKWYYTDVLEATITHDYYLNNGGYEVLWENCK